MSGTTTTSWKLAVAATLVAVAGLARADGLSIDRPMGEAVARSMLGRFGYGATPATLAAASAQTPRQYLLHAIHDGTRLPPSIGDSIAALPVAEPVESIWARFGPGGSAREGGRDVNARQALQQEERQYAGAAMQARLLTLANADNQGHEALLSFWLNHFSIFAPKHLDKLLAWDYAQTLEAAMQADSFEALLRASFYHPAMQFYLDNPQSTAPTSPFGQAAAGRGKPAGINENLARELLELHTLGVDAGYTQQDVQALARIITGAGVYMPRMQARNLDRAGATRQGLFLFDPRRHDYGEKTFLGQHFPAGEGLTEIDRALHLIATHPATGRHLALKLAQRFLADDPPSALVDAMAHAFRQSRGRISATLWPLLQSPEFARSLARPGKFKEPVDYVLSVARAACGDQPIGNRLLLAAAVQDMGQAPFMHTTPDGYGARESDWLSPAAMAKRTRFALGVAAERVPLAEAARAMPGAAGGSGPGRGMACVIDHTALDALVGPLSAQTRAAAAPLPERERAALLLASPEFMRR